MQPKVEKKGRDTKKKMKAQGGYTRRRRGLRGKDRPRMRKTGGWGTKNKLWRLKKKRLNSSS